MPEVTVALLPSLIHPEQLPGRVAVVIDVLRATTTIIHALANGATEILPCGEVDMARQLAAQQTPPALLGGERHGMRIDGFDFGNSPFEYKPEVVGGRSIVFTTTNGTRAIAAASSAARLLIGAFVNRRALVDELKRDGRSVVLVCAGTDGGITAEDVLFAGAIASDLLSSSETSTDHADTVTAVAALEELDQPAGTDATECAVSFYNAQGRDDATRMEVLKASRGGRNLLELGMESDIVRASADNLFDAVPEWNSETGLVTLIRQ